MTIRTDLSFNETTSNGDTFVTISLKVYDDGGGAPNSFKADASIRAHPRVFDYVSAGNGPDGNGPSYTQQPGIRVEWCDREIPNTQDGHTFTATVKCKLAAASKIRGFAQKRAAVDDDDVVVEYTCTLLAG